MKRVISFGLWGDKPIYNIGAIKNADLALKFYPNYECWFYIHKDSVPSSTIEQLKLRDNVRIIFKYGNIGSHIAATWRFESIDDPQVEINLSRDTDARIYLREKLAVDEWIQSGKSFHIMRDHPEHVREDFPILAGMFGTRKLKNIPRWKSILDISTKKLLINKKDPNAYFTDQHFLRFVIYTHIKHNCLIHSPFNKLSYELDIQQKPFPIDYCDEYRYVGGYVYDDDTYRNEKEVIQKALSHIKH